MSIITKRLLVVLVGAVVALPTLSGCGGGGGSAPLSKQDESNFKGGPMPASARAVMQQKMQEARSKSRPQTPAR